MVSRIQTMIDNLKTAWQSSGNPNALKIFATGYCVPSANDECPSDSALFSGLAVIQGAWADIAAANPEVTFFDSALWCGAADMKSFSPSSFHVDSIHLNNKGYCSTWTQTAIQTYLGCGSPASGYSCTTVPTSPDGGVRRRAPTANPHTRSRLRFELKAAGPCSYPTAEPLACVPCLPCLQCSPNSTGARWQRRRH